MDIKAFGRRMTMFSMNRSTDYNSLQLKNPLTKKDIS